MKSSFDNRRSDIEFKQIKSDLDLDEVKELFLEYVQSLNIDLTFQNFQKELQELPAQYSTPSGALILARVSGLPAGCVALRKMSSEVCEMKRLYVKDCYRGFGIGKQLVTLIIEEARRLNYSYMRLDTLPTMAKAQELYKTYGFYEIEPYVYNPILGTKFMELQL